MLLYSRKKVRYRRDGYCWKKRKDGKTTREDHMKLKVQGTECIYGCYVHSAILPTFHRRCYWLLQNPDIVLVHYLNVPYPDDNKMVSPSLALCADKKQWTKEELVSQLKPMFYSEEDAEVKNELEMSTAETVESIVSQLLERQRSARTAAICKQLECGCPDSTCQDAKTCSQPIRRITSAKPEPSSDSNQVSSTTGSGLLVARGMSHNERTVPLHNLHPTQQLPHGSSSSQGNTPLVLSLSQLQTPGSLLILNSNQSSASGGHVASLVAQRHTRKEKHHDPPMEMENSHCQISQPVAPQMRGLSVHQQTTSSISNGSTSVGHQESSGSLDKMENSKYKRKQLSSSTNKPQMKSYLAPHLKDMGSSSEYYETLDLSQEDIQQTLSANMPLSCTQSDSRDDHKESSVLPGFEFDFNDVNPSSHVDDDVFVNLDAFDMISEFPDLEGLDHNHNGNTIGDSVVSGSENHGEVMDTEKGSNSPPRMDYREGTANITDYSPEWAYTEGGVKVLVTGPWYSNTSPYTVLFDSCPVPTTLVQSGVLRCYCPAHEAGMVTLQVACEGFVISNSAMFEYKRAPPGGNERAAEVGTREPQPHDSLLRFTLMQRLDSIDGRLDIKQEPQDSVENTISGGYEDKLVNKVQKFFRRSWKFPELVDVTKEWCETYKGMTLLHLSAALGYTRLICALIQWKTKKHSAILELEVDGMNQDADGFTPLMRACERGHIETSLLLHEWLPAAVTILNNSGESVLTVAKKSSHTKLASDLCTRINRNGSNYFLSTDCENESIERDSVDGTHTSLESLNSSRDDGVFLHPSSLNTSDFSGLNMELHVNIPQWTETQRDMSRNSSPSPSSQSTKGLLGNRLVKRPSVDSGIQLQSSVDSLPTIRINRNSKVNDAPKLSRFDRSMSLPLSTHSLDSGYDSNFDNFHASPRRMNYTLCEAQKQTSTAATQVDAEPVVATSSQQQQPVGEQDARVLTLAEQIIAAMPDRIKNKSQGEMMMLSSDDMEVMSMESPLLLDEPPSSSSSCCFDTNSEFNFDNSYRYYEVGTPCSSLSPGSCLPSPPFPMNRSPSPQPTTADFCEFLHASNSVYFEKDFSNLTLSDREQRELYEAAKVIQKAYRSYKGRKKLEQDKERQAAILIQNYYRRYKQYAYYKQMTHAAMVIQNGYRSYCENKRFKKNQDASVRIQNCYRNFREQSETPPTGLKRTYSQRRQHQAARKIQQFMRQSKNKLQRERAERERQGQCKGSPQN
ncbi:calmodulin-Hypothetical protein transcription activator [Nesidiocoris tenuis]|uniref:CG-1 domain-containing protein n=1 Tax=Nesidiocoris tenuis TaxID=355587 RepID=A0ABN7AZU2_9HEMI|nr:calmodulin-Hypothetical protein transcription activator [Nesidiocoris tenuis]